MTETDSRLLEAAKALPKPRYDSPVNSGDYMPLQDVDPSQYVIKGGAHYGAVFSACDMYRYLLWRNPHAHSLGSLMHWLMLNPSTADHIVNDATITRIEKRARKLGYSGVVVTNLFAFRATDPKDMRSAADPVGKFNDLFIEYAANNCVTTVCAWGSHGLFMDRGPEVLHFLQQRQVDLYALRVSEATGQPSHPLYLPMDLYPKLMPR